MNSTNDLTFIIKRYAGLWVALNYNLSTVISSGKSAKTVYEEAKIKGLKEPVLFKVPMKNIVYFGSGWLTNF